MSGMSCNKCWLMRDLFRKPVSIDTPERCLSPNVRQRSQAFHTEPTHRLWVLYSTTPTKNTNTQYTICKQRKIA